jgi:hypothetical protein
MPLSEPTVEDQRKLHAEVTQIANQRFLVTLFAITTFGVMQGWILPQTSHTSGAEIGGFIFAVSIVLCLILFGIFLLNHALGQMQRVFTSYLIITGASKWEQHWKQYREGGRHFGYTRPFTFYVFVLLEIITTVLPFIWPDVYGVQLAPVGGAIALGIVGLVLTLTMMVLTLSSKGENAALARWNALNR